MTRAPRWDACPTRVPHFRDELCFVAQLSPTKVWTALAAIRSSMNEGAVLAAIFVHCPHTSTTGMAQRWRGISQQGWRRAHCPYELFSLASYPSTKLSPAGCPAVFSRTKHGISQRRAHTMQAPAPRHSEQSKALTRTVQVRVEGCVACVGRHGRNLLSTPLLLEREQRGGKMWHGGGGGPSLRHHFHARLYRSFPYLSIRAVGLAPPGGTHDEPGK